MTFTTHTALLDEPIHPDPDTDALAAAYIRRAAVDDTDAGTLLAMVGLA